MFKSRKIAGLMLMGALMSAPVVEAQVPMPQQQQQQKIEVGDDEMSKFATIFQAIRMENNKFQQEMMVMMEEEGMEVQRFNEIHEASVNSEVEVDASADEKEKHQRILGKIEEKQVAIQGDMEKLISDEGMTVERYQEIAMHLPADPDLQEQLRAALGG